MSDRAIQSTGTSQQTVGHGSTNVSCMLHVAVLGPLSAVVDDGDGHFDVTPTTGREQLALAALALAAPAALTVANLADALYGDEGVRDSRNAVQAVVSRVRKALGDASACLETTPSGYRLIDTDVDVAAMRERRDAGDVDGALAMWRGASLADVSGSGLIDNERTRLEEVRASLTEDMLSARLDEDPPAAVADLEAAVGEQPLREHRWELLMLALYRSGRQAESLRAFRRARQHLSNELGLAPGPALVELEARILAHDPSLDAPSTIAAGPAGRLPTGTVTVLLCDVEGSVRRWESQPSETATLIEKMHLHWGDVVAESGGVIVKSTGDGVLALFTTASDAVRAAARAQRGQIGTGLSLRVALHTGEVVSTTDDVRGPTINRTARLLELAHGDQVLVSGTTAEVAGRTISDEGGDLRLRSLGQHWLRDVDEPVAVSQLVGAGLPSAFAPLRTSGPSHLPRPRHSLLGRETERGMLADLVTDHPLVTLLGTGGIGKTSLALAVGWTLNESRAVAFVDLASLQDPGQVAARVAETLVGPDAVTHRSPVERIVDRLGANDDLLIIDNAEHLLDAVASLADQLLQAKLSGSVLVTSRHPLAVDGESIFTLPPLPLPNAEDDLSATGSNPSVQLFVERMRAVSPSAELPDGMLPVVAHICRRLDGIPLAIELAAGRTALLTVDDIAARLDDQLRLLRQVPATRAARHANLEAVMTWSLDHLGLRTRTLFSYLSVMAGTFDVAGVEAFAARTGLDPDDALDDVSEMLAASLLAAEPDSGRLRMLEPIRQFALSELRANRHEGAARQAQADWITDRAVEAHRMQDERRVRLYRTFDADADQLIGALRWSSDHLSEESSRDAELHDFETRAERAGELALASSFWFLERDPDTGSKLFDELQQRIDQELHPLAWARVATAHAIVTAVLPSTAVRTNALEAVVIFDAHGSDERGIARIGATIAQLSAGEIGVLDVLAEAEALIPSDHQWSRGMVDLVAMMTAAAAAAASGNADSAAALRDDAVARGKRAASILRRLEDQWALGATLGELGRLHRSRGDYDEAAACYHESIDLFGDLEYHGLHYIFSELGYLASLQGHHEAAHRHHERGLELAIRDGNPTCHALALVSSARSELLAGDVAGATRLVQHARTLQSETALFSGGGDDLDEQLRLLGHEPVD